MNPNHIAKRTIPSHQRSTALPQFLYGVAYYPEHWDENIRRTDPELFARVGFNVVRMAEFAWDLMEPEPGEYDFALFDATVKAFATKGIKTILCTPTAAPPRWLSRTYPEILRMDDKGLTQVHGSRQHASHFSQVFRQYSRAITGAMAAHFKHSPDVIGWQTDNEFHCHFAQDHSPAAVAAFQDFLQRKYQSNIEWLNTAWGTQFWSQSYRCFSEIDTPRAQRPTHVNPSQVLDYHRFLSDGVTAFQREQIDLLRATNPNWWITHNGCFASIDYRGQFTRDLDFLSYDAYPFFDLKPSKRRFSHAFNLDYVRAFSGNFVVMEQQSGPGGQGDYLHDTPEPGEMRRMAYTGIARGADGVLFFRERSCRFGAEQFWCGIVDHDNVPRRRFEEATQLGHELRQLQPHLLGTSVRVDIAIAGADFDSQHAHYPLSHGLPTPRQAAESIHTFFQSRKHAVGIVHPEDDLTDCRIFIIPHMAVFNPDWIPAIEQWIASGGTLIVGARSGSKNLNNHVIADSFPGCLQHLTGVTVEEFGKQNCPEERPLNLRMGRQRIDTSVWYESLHLVDKAVKVLAFWDNRHLVGAPAVTVNRCAKGSVIYVGTQLSNAVMEGLYKWMMRRNLVPAQHAFPDSVEVVTRQHADGSTLDFLIHHGDFPITVPVKGYELLSGTTNQSLELMPNQVAIVKNTP